MIEPSQFEPAEISEELDGMSCDLIETALDALACGMDISVLVSLENQEGQRLTQVFNDDSIVACLDGAKEYIASDQALVEGLSVVRYALTYLGSVEVEPELFEDALILEYGEKGAEAAYSAYSLVSGIGEGENFLWTDPAPAGLCQLLV